MTVVWRLRKCQGNDCETERIRRRNAPIFPLKKELLSCGDDRLNVLCSYLITVRNTGSNPYNAPLVVRDVPQAGATSVQFASWNCTSGPGNGYLCDYGDANLAPGGTVTLLTWMKVPKQVVRNNNCRIRNRAHIELKRPGGSRQNTNPLG